MRRNIEKINKDILLYHIIPFIDNNDRYELSIINHFLYSFQNEYVYRKYILHDHKMIQNLVDRIKNNVTDTQKQVSIIIKDTSTDICSLSFIDTLSLCSCREITDISPLHDINKLILTNTNIKHFGALSNIHTLILQRCRELTDVTPFKGVHTLDLSYCRYIARRLLPYLAPLQIASRRD